MTIIPMPVMAALLLTAAATPAFAAQSLAHQHGMASVYSYRGGRTASGESSRPGRLTAAHRSIAFGTMVRITNRRNGRTVVVRINDRGEATWVFRRHPGEPRHGGSLMC